MVRILMVGGPGWRVPVSPGFLDAVVVVAGSFDHAGVAAVSPLRVDLASDLGDDVR